MPQRTPIRLSALRKQLLAPHINPADLETEGDFWLLDYEWGARGVLLFTILPLQGDRTGVAHLLALPDTAGRARIGQLVLQYSPIGPLVLRRKYLGEGLLVWDFAELMPDGTYFSMFVAIDDHVPEDHEPELEPI
jgi:hypothetical protein